MSSQLMKCTQNSWVHKCAHTLQPYKPQHMRDCSCTCAYPLKLGQTHRFSHNFEPLRRTTHNHKCLHKVSPLVLIYAVQNHSVGKSFPASKHMRTHTNPHSLTQSSILTVQIVLVTSSSKLLYHHRCFWFYFQFGNRTHRECFTWWLALGLFQIFQNIVLPTQKRSHFRIRKSIVFQLLRSMFL